MSATIYALSSASGRAAVAVIRVSGPLSQRILHDMAGSCPPPRTAVLRKIIDPRSGDPIDEGLVLFFAAPNSATGEDLAEFQVHGGRAVLQAMFEALSTFDACRPAEAGEFARRGFENGKLDLTAVEGIADLVDAETEAQRRQAQRQAGGALARLYDGWRERLIAAQALVEAAIDFSDEGDVGVETYRTAGDNVATLVREIEGHLAGATFGEIIRSGFQVVIAGPPNAGKSSLLNALARRDAAIVSEQAGTTRDVIEVHLDLAGLPVILSDTAGIRQSPGSIEQEGIRRALDRARAADLVLWLCDATLPDVAPEPPVELRGSRHLTVTTKIDLLDDPDPSRGSPSHAGALAISSRTGAGLDDLIARIVALARAASDAGDDLVPTNARHRHHLEAARDQLRVFQNSNASDLELRAEDLRIAASALGRLTGRIDVEDILDQIFSRFCIGK